jgi:hypothetical protein
MRVKDVSPNVTCSVEFAAFRTAGKMENMYTTECNAWWLLSKGLCVLQVHDVVGFGL